MPYTQQQHDKRQLNRWARYLGYADFETYLQTGGTVTEALSVLRNLRDSVDMAIRSIVASVGEVPGQHYPPREHPEPEIHDILPGMRVAGAPHDPADHGGTPHDDDKPDAGNAHPQGEEVVDAGAGH
jgi:hypothetical protein